MHDTILSELLARGSRAARLEIERHQILAVTGQGNDLFRLTPRRAQPVETRPSCSSGSALRLNATGELLILLSFGPRFNVRFNTWIVAIKDRIGQHSDLP